MTWCYRTCEIECRACIGDVGKGLQRARRSGVFQFECKETGSAAVVSRYRAADCVSVVSALD